MSTLDPHAETCNDHRNPLMVPELFYSVLDYFCPEFYPEERQTLAALAQTCRAFSEPSLDRLWRKTNSLKPLIRCYTTVDDVENMIPPTSSQLAILDRYSHRIRELTICESTSLRFLQCTSMQPSVLLPNLTVLEWHPRSLTPHVPIIFIQRLLSPTLVSLTVNLSEADGATLLSFFDNYPLLCRNLKSVNFRFSAGSQTATTTKHALSRAICNQEDLENVAIRAPIDHIAFRHLSTMPTLKTLTVNLTEISRSQTRSFLPTDPLFCSVEELEFEASDLDLVTSLLRPRDQIFHTFRLCRYGRQPSDAFVAFLNVLASQSRTTPLQKLILSCGHISLPLSVDQMATEAMRYSLTYEILQPLTVLGSLRVLMIEWNEQISLDDDDVANLARSWPMLQVFHFYCLRGGHGLFSTKYATLRSVLTLAKSCPELHTISLPLDARQVPVVDEAEPLETNFSCVIVPESPIDDAGPVAEFLLTHLPCVTAVDAEFMRMPGTNSSQLMEYEVAWAEVQTRLEVFNGWEEPGGYSSDDTDTDT